VDPGRPVVHAVEDDDGATRDIVEQVVLHQPEPAGKDDAEAVAAADDIVADYAAILKLASSDTSPRRSVGDAVEVDGPCRGEREMIPPGPTKACQVSPCSSASDLRTFGRKL
jgi:hypothetical protein